MKKSIVAEKSFELAIAIIELYRKLVESKEFVLSKQLLRSATSIGANIQEALAGGTRRDFSHRMLISSREARETKYWLLLLDKSQIVEINYSSYLEKTDELIRMLTAIVKTTQKS